VTLSKAGQWLSCLKQMNRSVGQNDQQIYELAATLRGSRPGVQSAL